MITRIENVHNLRGRKEGSLVQHRFKTVSFGKFNISALNFGTNYKDYLISSYVE